MRLRATTTAFPRPARPDRGTPSRRRLTASVVAVSAMAVRLLLPPGLASPAGASPGDDVRAARAEAARLQDEIEANNARIGNVDEDFNVARIEAEALTQDVRRAENDARVAEAHATRLRSEVNERAAAVATERDDRVVEDLQFALAELDDRQAALGAAQAEVEARQARIEQARAEREARAAQELGKPYRYAASGPDAYDCSGLTRRAWQQAGVDLPHSSRMQYAALPKVARDQLRPGDLLFYGSPIHHVGIYVGNEQYLHAPHTGAVVRINSIHRSGWAGAARPG